jgi:hypothetical protein
MNADNCIFTPQFKSLLDPLFTSGSVKDKMPLDVARKRASLRFVHTPTEHAQALARIASTDEAHIA